MGLELSLSSSQEGMNSTTQPCRAPQAYAVKLSQTLVLNVEKTVQKLQNENWTLKEGKSDMLHEKVINQNINRLKSGMRRENAQRSSCSQKKCEKGGEHPSPSPTT